MVQICTKVDIVDKPDAYEAYIFKDSYGVKKQMAEAGKNDFSREEYMNMIQMQLEEAITDYKEDVIIPFEKSREIISNTYEVEYYKDGKQQTVSIVVYEWLKNPHEQHLTRPIFVVS